MSARGLSVLKIAPPYDDDLIRHIEREFSVKLGFEVQFEVIEDPILLCGFIAYVRGTVYDASSKTQLTGIRKYLLDSVIVPPPSVLEEVEEA